MVLANIALKIIKLYPNYEKGGMAYIPTYIVLYLPGRILFQSRDRSPGSPFNSICLTGKSFAFIIKAM